MNLNQAQSQAIHLIDKPVLVLAGAGSGKTRVITEKIAYLVEVCGMEPRYIAAVTFTNKAANEMRERIAARLGDKAVNKNGQGPYGATVTTFHSLGMNIVRREYAALGLKENFSILDQQDCAGVIRDALVTTDKQLIRRVQSQISLWKNALLSPDQAKALATDADSLQAAKVYQHYGATLQAWQALDFDDLLTLPHQLLTHNEAVRTKWQRLYRYWLIDEYQDTNTCQYEVLKLLVGEHQRFTAVGDDDQAIYAWRGATVENLQRLQTDFAQLQVVKLEQNYRSTVRILEAANRLIAHNPKLFGKNLWSEFGLGAPIQYLPFDDDAQEAESIVFRLLGHKTEHRAKYSDYAILYRGNYQARILEQHLRQQKVPYVISGGQSFFDKQEIRDVCAYLRLISNQDDDPAYIRAITTPRRGIGDATLAGLGAYAGTRQVSLFAAVFEMGLEARLQERQIEPLRVFGAWINQLTFRARNEPAGVLLQELIKTIDYEHYLFQHEDERTAQGRWQNVLDFVAWLTTKGEEDGKTLLELTQWVALITMLGEQDGEQDAVKLSTIHAAKGLEYPHVFLIGAEEGILPHQATGEDMTAAKIEEERRLMYVAITRAQRSLHVTWCKKRQRAREAIHCQVSRFVEEMRGEDTAMPVMSAEEKAKTTKDRFANLKALLTP